MGLRVGTDSWYMKHLLKLAAKIAKTGYQERTFFLGAIGVRADGRVVTARNRTNKVPDVCGHAEARLIRKLGKNAPLVIVVRYRWGKGDFGMAKPCIACEKRLEKAGVMKVVYTAGPTELRTLSF